MALHELVSNAVKYGGLSTTSGRLTINWNISRIEDVPTLKLVWTEAGGPVVSVPSRRGFGTTLIERSLAHELDAGVYREFLASGLQCTIAIPFTDEIGRLMQNENGRGVS
jgi:two-component system CheB/CheR fusion protein